MANKPTERCLICGSRDRWRIENSYLTDGSKSARALSEELGFSKSSYYRHIKSHMSVRVENPPINPSAIDWVRAAINIAAAVEAFRIISNPKGIGNIAILVGNDDLGQFVELAIIYLDGSLDNHQVECMAHDLNMVIDDVEISAGITATRSMSAKLHAPLISVGKRSE